MDNETVRREDIKRGLEAWLTMDKYYHPKSKSNKIPLPEIFDVIDNLPTPPHRYTDGYIDGFKEGYRQAITDINHKLNNKIQEILEEVNTNDKATTD